MPIGTKEIEGHIDRNKRLRTARATWESHWQDVCKFFIPRKATITGQRTPGGKRLSEIYDSTAFRALDVLAAGLNNYLTSTVNKWFELKTEQGDLMETEEVKAWLQDVEKKTYAALAGSNFGNEIHESYIDDGSIGTSILYVEEDPKDLVRFYARHISECVICEDSRGRVDTVYRTFPFTARQAYQVWGAASPESVVKAKEKDPEKQIEFMHAVFPRADRDSRRRDRLNMPWASLYVDTKGKHLISESGYFEMPYLVSRWLKGTSEVYGRSPAMIALPDVKMLNQMSKTTLRASQKAVDPPLMLPDDGVVGSVRTVPGGISYLRANVWAQGMRPETMKLGGDVRLGLEMENQRRESINRSMFVDLFLMLTERPEMTATEVLERVEERMSILGPVLTRAMAEKLDPLIDRVFGILLRAGHYPRPPGVLSGQKLTIEYVSPLARVQRLYEVKAVRQTMRDLEPYLQLFPEMADNLSPDELFRVIADVHAFPQSARRPKKQVEEIRRARQEVSGEEAAKGDASQAAQVLATLKKAGVNVPLEG